MSSWEHNIARLGMDAGEYAMVLGLTMLGSSVFFYLVWRNWKRARLIEDTPTSKIRSAVQGYVEISGLGQFVEGMEIRSPLKGIACLWYQYKVQEKRSSGKNSHWKTVDEGVSDKPFLLKDSTGECLVDPVGAEISESRSDTWLSSDPRVHGQENYKGLFGFHKQYRLIERRLHPGPVYVIGFFKTETSLDQPLHTEVAQLLREWKSKPTELLTRFDANLDGKIDVEEWDLARAQATDLLQKERLQKSADPVVHRLQKPQYDQQPYLIAGKDQRDLARKFRWMAIGSLAGFTAALVVMLYLIQLAF